MCFFLLTLHCPFFFFFLKRNFLHPYCPAKKRAFLSFLVYRKFSSGKTIFSMNWFDHTTIYGPNDI